MSPAPILLRWQLPATHHDTRQHDAVLNDNAVTYLSAQSGSQFELFGSYHESQLQLMRSGEQLQIWLNGRKLAVIEQFFAQAANAEDRSAENDFLFTDSEQGKLLLSQSAAADNEGLLWPDSGEDNHDSLPVWICAAGLLGGSLALGGSSDHGVVDNTPPAAAHFALREDTGLSDRDFITQRPEIQVELASDTVSWEYSLDGGNHWHPGSGNQLLLAENSRYERGAIAIRQTDAAGNVSAIASNAATIVVDNSAPAAPTFLLAADTGSSNSDNIAQDATVVVTLASDAASWQYKLKEADWSAPIATTTLELAADTHYAAGEIQLRQTDAAGNVSAIASNAATIVVDNSAPATPTFLLAADTGSSNNDNITQDATVVVTLASDAASWQYKLKEADWSAPIATATTTFELAADTRYAAGEIQLRQSDAAGNPSAVVSNSSDVTVDTAAASEPSLRLFADSGSSASDGITRDATVVVTLASDTDSWQYKLKDAAWSSPIATATTTFELAADTRYAAGEIQLRQTDAAGNPSAIASNSSAITVDNSAPSRATVNTATLYSAPTDDPENAQYVTGTAALASGDRLNVTIGGQQFDNVAVTDGSWQIERSELGPLESGATLEVTATTLDLAGNQTSDDSSEELQVQRSDIVIFDLTSGKSSFHGADRLFSVDETYNIFIIVDSDGVAMQSIATEQQWRGWDQLSSDDTLWLVGNELGSDIVGSLGGIIGNDNNLIALSVFVWASQSDDPFYHAAFTLSSSGMAFRGYNSTTATNRLFNGANGKLNIDSGVAQGYLQTIHANTNFANIFTTQGLS